MNITTTDTVFRSQVTVKSQNAQYLHPRFAVRTASGDLMGISGQEADLLAAIGTVDVLAVEDDPKPPTPRERWNAALKAARKAGVAVQQNIAGCCYGCAEPFKGNKKVDLDSTPLAYFIHAQGMGISWNTDGTAVAPNEYGFATDRKAIYFHHRNGGAQALAAAFREQGFEVEWDGTMSDTVKVTVPARRKQRWER